jgi:hypothetical protein
MANGAAPQAFSPLATALQTQQQHLQLQPKAENGQKEDSSGPGSKGGPRVCEVCGSAPSKYCCPGCERRTCSLACSKKHKVGGCGGGGGSTAETRADARGIWERVLVQILGCCRFCLSLKLLYCAVFVCSCVSCISEPVL